ncbi:MAG: hypothetical protein ABL872_05365 [Lacibacter sp.]
MRQPLLLVLAIPCFLIFQCNTNPNKVSIEIRQFAGAAGLTIIYLIDDKSIRIDTNCDLENCKRKTVYTRDLTDEQSNSLFHSLKSLQLDTLKTEYNPQGLVFDGLISSIKLGGSELPNKNISIDNVDVPVIDSLYKIIDRLILIKKYQFYRFGQE